MPTRVSLIPFWAGIVVRFMYGEIPHTNPEEGMMSKTHLIKTDTKQVVRTFDTRKSAERFAKLYNDLCGQQAAFSTKAAK
jgi:hypothetical protein